MKKSEWQDTYLKIGEMVNIKKGAMCPDFKDLDIGGWQGIVTEVTEDDGNNVLIGIHWSLATIQNMPENFVQQGEEDGLDNGLMYLLYEDISRKGLQ